MCGVSLSFSFPDPFSMYTLCKLLYITVFALLSAVPPYLQIYYHDVLYFSSNQIGCVLAIAPFIQSLACPIWTYLVDKRPKLHGSIMAFTSLMGGLAILGIMILGHQQQQEDTTKDPSTPLFLSLILNNNNEQHSPPPPATQQTVILTSLCALMFAFFTLPNVSLVDSAVMKILGSNKILYGKYYYKFTISYTSLTHHLGEQRLWGSVSAGFTILVVGELINLTNNLDAIFWVFGASTLAFIVISLSANNVISSSVYKDDDYKATECSKLLATNESRQQLNNEEDYEKEGSARGRYQSTMMHDERGLYRPTSCNSTVLSIAHDLREEADELLDTNVSPTTAPLQTAGLAISRVSSLEHSMLGGRELIDATSSASLSSTTAAATPMSSSNSHYQARFFTSPRVACFLITTLLFGVVLSMVVNFLFLFLSNDLHTPASWIGWTGPLQALTELLCFCFSKQVRRE